MDTEYYIGIMSGTSMDGVDVALVACTPDKARLVAADCYPMPADLRTALIALCQEKLIGLQTLGELDHRLGKLFAEAVDALLAKNDMTAAQICAIGSHGQTVFHAPTGQYPFTLQIGDANLIAAHTGITTVADFRRKDMAWGGQGAPLVPAFHRALFADDTRNKVILNIGGISNITALLPGQPVTGYDTGPGNLLLDAWVMQHLGQHYDKDAAWARTGKIDSLLLEQWLADDYFSLPAPKSTGRELFNPDWLAQQLQGHTVSAQDVQATLVAFTAVSIAQSLQTLPLAPGLPCELLVCGGGAKNPLIMQQLAAHLPDWSVGSTDNAGINGDYLEAMAFAWLAHQRMHALPGNLAAVTGARREIALGAIYPADGHFSDDRKKEL